MSIPEINIIFFAFAAMLLWGFSDFLIQKISRKLGSLEALIWINLIGSIALFPFFYDNFAWEKIRGGLPSLFFLGVMDIIFGLAILRAYEKGKLSVVEIIMVLELPFTILFGIAFFREKLTLFQFFLTGVILAGVFLISTKAKTIKSLIKEIHAWEAGVMTALAAAFLSGLFNFALAAGSRSSTPILAIWFSWMFSFAILAIYILATQGWEKTLAKFKNNKTIVISGSIINMAAWLFFAIAIAEKELSITTAITESYPALSLFMGIRFNKEKISKLQFVGAGLAIIGSIILTIYS